MKASTIRSDPFAIFLLTCVTFLCYANSLRNEFVWDDHYQIEQNRLLRSWAFVPRLFRSENAESYSVTGESIRFFRPLCLLTHLINFQFEYKNRLLVSALFLAHPIQTEAVTYISSRATLLSAMFLFVATMSLLLSCAASNRPANFLWAAISVAAFACAVLSKEIGAIFPFQAALICLLQPNKPARKRGLAIVAACFVALAVVWVLRLEILPEPQFTTTTSLAKRGVLALAAFAEYLRILIAPINLHMEHATPNSKTIIAAGALALIFFGYILVRQWKRESRLVLGCGMFLLGFAPVSGLIPLNATFAEAWMYWPIIGLMICLTVWLDRAAKSARYHQATTAFAGAILVTFCALTIRQNRVWTNELTLCETTIARGCDTVRIRSNLARALIDAGRYDEAREQLRFALKADPHHAASIRGVGILTAREGNERGAQAFFEQALALDPSDNVAALWLSALQERLSETDRAEYTLQFAAEHEKTFAARLKLATLYAKSGKLDQAEGLLRDVLRNDPLHAAAHNALGTVLMREGKPDEATTQFLLALRYDRWMIDPYANLAAVASARGDLAAALRYYDDALRLAPGNADLHYAIGIVLQRTGKRMVAERAFARAFELDPELTNAAPAR
jgi:tetratricopeptide (TPR) repeat protein